MKNKQKTKKILTKRFKVTRNGKVMRRQAFTGHLNEKRSRKKKMNSARPKQMKGHLARKIRKSLGK